MRKLIYIVPILFMLACETVVHVDLPKLDDKIVINAIYSTDTTSVVSLSRTNSVLDGSVTFKSIEDAEIILRDENVADVLTHDRSGLYRSRFRPSAGTDYTLEVISKRFGKASAKFKVPEVTPIKSVEYKKGRNREHEFTLKFNDPVDEENYYAVAVYTYNKRIEDLDQNKYRNYYTYEPEPPFDSRTEEFELRAGRYVNMFADGFFDGEEVEFSMNLSYGSMDSAIDNEVYFELYTISKEFYDYYKTKEHQANVGGSPFTQPVIVYSNIENGVGIVGAYSVDKKIVVVDSFKL